MKEFVCKIAGVEHTLRQSAAPDQYELDGKLFAASVDQTSADLYSVLIDGESFAVKVSAQAGSRNGGYFVSVGKHEFSIEVIDRRRWTRAGDAVQAAGRQPVAAPMPGKVVRLLVAAGQAVKAGEGLVVVEAMKMQNELKSPKAGHVISLSVSEGQTVTAGQQLMVIE